MPSTPSATPAAEASSAEPGGSSLETARRRLILDAAGLSVSAIAFGLVYGLAARTADYSLVEMLAMSTFVLAGAAQFAAIGLVAGGVPWAAILLLTTLLNARHVLYSAALAPWLTGRRRLERAAMAYVLTDETFGLALPHFRRLGRADVGGYWIATAFIVPMWFAANMVGFLGGQGIPDPTRLGIDVIFPAAMAGLAAALVTGRQELVAAVAGAIIAVAFGVAVGPSAGIVAGGLLAPLVAMLVRHDPARPDVEGFEGYGMAPLPHDDGENPPDKDVEPT
ncbi:MAG: AzlC family ABC transporter permease [Candidatus Limnocylindrales bacterium]